MGRYDVLTQLDKKPLTTTPPSEKAAPLPVAPLLENQVADRPARTQTDEQVNKQTQKPVKTQTDLHANMQTSKDASMQARKPVNVQIGKPASMQTGKQVSLQTGKQVIIEKYSSYLTHEYKRELKRIAFESDRNEYEVLMEAIEQYLTGRRQPK